MTINEYVAKFLLRQRFCNPKNREAWNRVKLVLDLLCKEFAAKSEPF